MSGPFALRYLHLFLQGKSAGAFILSKNGRSADRVGASPDDLAAAIRRSASESGYRYFWFAHTSSADEAYDLEHAWSHRYHPTDHPSPPSTSQRVSWYCTTEGCAACALTAIR